MKISLSQPTYAVRDASEIAFGLLTLGMVFLPVAMAVGFLVGFGVAALWPAAQPPPWIPGVGGIATWLIAMWLVVRRYQKAAARWGEERRGRGLIHLLEWITVLLGLLFSWAQGDGHSEGLAILRTFCAVLMLLLLLSHVATYCLLRYRPHAKEIAVWSAMGVALVIELVRSR